VRDAIGCLPGELALDERLTGRQMLAFLANLRPGGAAAATATRRAELCERLGLTGADLDRVIRDDSRGTKQKIGVVAAFQHDPLLLILDEPTTGLDPLVREEVFGLLVEAGRAGRTVFHSSHVISEVDRTCTRVAILRRGRLVAVEHIEAIRRSLARKMVVRFGAPVDPASLAGPGTEVLEHSDATVVLRISGDLNPLLRTLAAHDVRHLAFPEPELDEAFIRHYRDADATGEKAP
jgi:ABC-2 type transport system ATP-binding protein